MNKIFFVVVIILMLNINQNAFAEPIENDFGIVDAWFNGKEATVENVQLKIGEKAEVKVEVTSKINGHVIVKLINPLVTESYEVITGPSLIDKRIDNLNIESGWTETYVWTIKPTGKWTNGNAPINLYVQFNEAYDEYERVQFTIANPYILDEQYPGSTPKPTPDPKSTDQPPYSEGSPGFGVMVALMGVAVVVLTRRSLH